MAHSCTLPHREQPDLRTVNWQSRHTVLVSIISCGRQIPKGYAVCSRNSEHGLGSNTCATADSTKCREIYTFHQEVALYNTVTVRQYGGGWCGQSMFHPFVYSRQMMSTSVTVQINHALMYLLHSTLSTTIHSTGSWVVKHKHLAKSKSYRYLIERSVHEIINRIIHRHISHSHSIKQ